MKIRQNGFTLIEMLIALIIVTVAFTAVIFSINQNVRTLHYLQRKTAAIWLAEDVITRSQLKLLRANSGSETMLSRHLNWRIESKSTESAAVVELRVTITDIEDQSTLLSMTAYRGATGG
ncbi:MAG: type II secretion system minor pseudopilin GspI [Pseudomonadota bacterium]|nr:type II secretion system minor pseudopilin GspI [Pseudomonadota bacterium]